MVVVVVVLVVVILLAVVLVIVIIMILTIVTALIYFASRSNGNTNTPVSPILYNTFFHSSLSYPFIQCLLLD